MLALGVTSVRAGVPAVGTLSINGVEIRGIERIEEVKPQYCTPQGIAEMEKSFRGDGLDEVLFAASDSTLWIAFGKYVHLYTDNADRVQSAFLDDRPIRVIAVNDENREIDARPTLGAGMVAILFVIVLAGLGGGIAVGLVGRRNLAGLGRDPLMDRAFYGLILGVMAALVFYGMSNRKLDFRRLFTTSSTSHLDDYLVSPMK